MTDITVTRQRERLEQEDFLLLNKTGDSMARFRFLGSFQGQQVTWVATLQTLASYAAQHPEQAVEGYRNFIELGEMSGDVIDIHIGLNISRIDTPAIRKTIMMVRQYKNLSPGRHEYGETIFPFELVSMSK